MEIENEFIQSTIRTFQSNKSLADRAIEQVTDAQLSVSLHPETNSIAVIMKHVGGNLRSRWMNFINSDGEKPDRNRDQEFIDSYASRGEVLEDWNCGFACLFDSLGRLNATDFQTHVYIRGQQHSIPLAIQRSLAHTCYHVGQIVQIARHHAGDQWETLTIPRGKSEQFNQETWGTKQKR